MITFFVSFLLFLYDVDRSVQKDSILPADEGAASLRTKEARPYGRRRRVPTDEGAASPRTKEARPYGRRRRVPTDEGAASPRTKEARPYGRRSRVPN
ncbi:MAG: hypothetical protein LBG27_09355, partial [Spirochaetaceae bacterium]|nr:hypothetical protein [Spirochaetaceae bacterium]